MYLYHFKDAKSIFPHHDRFCGPDAPGFKALIGGTELRGGNTLNQRKQLDSCRYSAAAVELFCQKSLAAFTARSPRAYRRFVMLCTLTAMVLPLWSMALVAGGRMPRAPRAMRELLKPMTKR